MPGRGGRSGARQRAGPSHLVVTAEYAAAPWFDGIVGVRDPATHELYLLFPTWGRRGVIAYFDSPPGGGTDVDACAQRFQASADSLGLGAPPLLLTPASRSQCQLRVCTTAARHDPGTLLVF